VAPPHGDNMYRREREPQTQVNPMMIICMVIDNGNNKGKRILILSHVAHSRAKMFVKVETDTRPIKGTTSSFRCRLPRKTRSVVSQELSTVRFVSSFGDELLHRFGRVFGSDDGDLDTIEVDLIARFETQTGSHVGSNET
jgi:hypothetical protein